MAPPLFRLKSYQQNTLAALRRYLMKCVESNDAATAFYALTGRPYIAPPSLPDLPYICLRIPTGGGKTLLAAHSIRLVTDDYLRTDTPTVL
jgi:type III restriction enzyme